MSDRFELYEGDALAILRELADASVHAMITDPPYSSGGMMRGDRTLATQRKYLTSDSGLKAATLDFSGDGRDQRAYAYWCALWLGEALRVVRPGGVCALFCDWRQLPATTDALQAGGWVWRGIVPWYKPINRPQAGRFAAACEYVVWGSRGGMPLDRAQPCLPGFLTDGYLQGSAPRGAEREHVAQKPLGIMRELVKIAPPDGIVLDLFAGAGTTGVAALLEGRRFIGGEQTPHYAAVMRRRLAAALDG